MYPASTGREAVAATLGGTRDRMDPDGARVAARRLDRHGFGGSHGGRAILLVPLGRAPLAPLGEKVLRQLEGALIPSRHHRLGLLGILDFRRVHGLRRFPESGSPARPRRHEMSV